MDLFKVIAEMSGEGQNLVIPRLYVQLAGGHTEALVLKQLVFWSNKTKRTDGYFYKKSEELENETMLTRRQIDRIVEKLIKLELIEVERKKANGAPTRHFKIKQELIISRLHHLVQSNARDGAILGLHETVQSITDSNTDDNNRQIPTTAKSSIDDNYRRVHEHYMNAGWGMPNGFTSQDLQYDIEDYGVDLILQGIELAAKRNAKSYEYARKIIKEWSEKGLTTSEQVIQYEEAKVIEFEKRKNRKGGKTRAKSGGIDEQTRKDYVDGWKW